MLTEMRQQRILQLLERDHTVQLQTLMTELSVSESTIRRDLSQLEEAGRCIRVHGGAKRAYHLELEPTFQEKAAQNSVEKEHIAQQAAQLVQTGTVIYLDAGTTTLAMIPHLVGKDILVVTNGIRHAELLSDYQLKVIVVGGELKAKTRAMIGATAQQQLRGYRFDQVFMGMNGVDTEYGYTTPDVEEAAVKLQAMQQANQVYVLADSSKIGKVNFCHVADLDDAMLLTNHLSTAQRASLTRLTQVKEC